MIINNSIVNCHERAARAGFRASCLMKGESDVEFGASSDMSEVLLELRADTSPPSDEMRAGVESRPVTLSEEDTRWFR